MERDQAHRAAAESEGGEVMAGEINLARKLLEMELRRRLEAHRYESSTGRGMRGLMPHHVDALVADLLPFIENQIRLAKEGQR